MFSLIIDNYIRKFQNCICTRYSCDQLFKSNTKRGFISYNHFLTIVEWRYANNCMYIVIKNRITKNMVKETSI